MFVRDRDMPYRMPIRQRPAQESTESYPYPGANDNACGEELRIAILPTVFVAFAFQKGPVHSDTHDGLAGSLSFSSRYVWLG